MKVPKLVVVATVVSGMLLAILAPSVALGNDDNYAVEMIFIDSQSGYMYEGETDAVVTFPVNAFWTTDFDIFPRNEFHLLMVWDALFAPEGISVPDVTLAWPGGYHEWTTTMLIMRGDSAGSVRAGSYGFTVYAVDTVLPPAPPIPPAHGTLVIEPPDNSPAARDRTFDINEDTWLGFSLKRSDPDPGDTLRYLITAWPSHGSPSGTAPDLLYMPDPHFAGTHSFRYRVFDNHNLGSAEATVTIHVNPVNDPPVADASLDQVVEANAIGGATGIMLDGSGSYDPDGDVLTYGWTWGGNSVTEVTPTVSLSLGTTTVTLTVSDGEHSDTDTVDVSVVDTTPPLIAAPPDVEVTANTAGGYSGPIGMATASDICDASVAITNNAPPIFPLCRTVVTWTATDDSGNSSSASQVVTVRPLAVVIDIRPNDYPNNVNLRSRGVLPVAILTTPDFDASSVLISSAIFAGAQPVRWQSQDVDRDGDVDLLLQFRVQELNLSAFSVEVVLTGTTMALVPFEGRDSVRIVP